MSVNQSELARAWGISRQRVSQMKKEGMPLSSVEEAEAWRSARYGGAGGSRQQCQDDKSDSINYGGAVLPPKPEKVRAADIQREDFLGTMARLKKNEMLTWGLLAESVSDWQKGVGKGDEVLFRERLYKDAVALRVAQEGKVDEILMRRGELVTMAESDAKTSRFLHGLRLALRTMPSRLAARCNPSDPELAKTTLTDAMERIFKTMHKWNEET